MRRARVGYLGRELLDDVRGRKTGRKISTPIPIPILHSPLPQPLPCRGEYIMQTRISLHDNSIVLVVHLAITWQRDDVSYVLAHVGRYEADVEGEELWDVERGGVAAHYPGCGAVGVRGAEHLYGGGVVALMLKHLLAVMIDLVIIPKHDVVEGAAEEAREVPAIVRVCWVELHGEVAYQSRFVTGGVRVGLSRAAEMRVRKMERRRRRARDLELRESIVSW